MVLKTGLKLPQVRWFSHNRFPPPTHAPPFTLLPVQPFRSYLFSESIAGRRCGSESWGARQPGSSQHLQTAGIFPLRPPPVRWFCVCALFAFSLCVILWSYPEFPLSDNFLCHSGEFLRQYFPVPKTVSAQKAGWRARTAKFFESPRYLQLCVGCLTENVTNNRCLLSSVCLGKLGSHLICISWLILVSIN